MLFSHCPSAVDGQRPPSPPSPCPFGAQHWDGLGHVFVELWARVRAEIRGQRARTYSPFFSEGITRAGIHLRPAGMLYARASMYCHQLQFAVLRNVSGESFFGGQYECHHVPDLDE